MGDPAKPLRIVLGWQLVVTMLLAGIGAWLAGVHGALSAILGGAVAMMGGLTFTLLAKPQKASVQTSAMAWDGLGRILKAEGAKVLVMIVSLWLVLASYHEVVILGFIGTFILSVVIFSTAIFLRNPVSLEADKNNVN
ncbi:MAG: ATP synthase subunit I [Sterolibacterium sp.]